MVLPLPSHEDWIKATDANPDLRHIKTALLSKSSTPTAGLRNKGYVKAIKLKQLGVKNGVVFWYEVSRKGVVRQLRMTIPAPKLRRTPIAACHASPYGGQTSHDKTYHKVVLCYWWPGMYMDVSAAVLGCAHCYLANATYHADQVILDTHLSDTPFNVC